MKVHVNQLYPREEWNKKEMLPAGKGCGLGGSAVIFRPTVKWLLVVAIGSAQG